MNQIITFINTPKAHTIRRIFFAILVIFAFPNQSLGFLWNSVFMVLGNLVFIIWMFPWIYFVIIISVPVLGGLHELMDLLKRNSSQERRQLPQLSLLNLQSIIYIFATVLTLFMPFITSDNQDWQLRSTLGTLGYAVWGLWLGIYLLSCASITRQKRRNEKSSLERGVDKGLELVAGISLIGGVLTYLMGSGYSLYLLNLFYQGEGEYAIKKTLESFSWDYLEWHFLQ